MKKIILPCLMLAYFLIALSCQSSNQEKKVDYEKWMESRCGRCHAASEFKELVKITSRTKRADFDAMLQGMAHGNVRMNQGEIMEALDYFESKELLLKEEAEQSGE